MIVQDALPPYTMRCLTCGRSWEPEPAKSGPNKGQHTDASLNRAAHDHTCPHPDEEFLAHHPEWMT